MHNFGVMAQGLLTGESRFLCLCDFKELGVAKQSRSTTSARSALRQPWSIIARTNFLKAATNLNFVQPKLFQASRQDDLRFSDCTVSVIQILDDADAAFRILGAGLRTVLSVTTMFADKPHHLNGRMRAAILCFDDLASGYRTRGWATRRAGYRAAISCSGTFETCRRTLRMSANRGGPEVTG